MPRTGAGLPPRVALVLVDRTLMAMRWIDLLVALAPGSRPPLSAVVRVFFVSSFVSNVIPSVGADLYRAYELSRYNVHLAESTASVLMDRALGVLSVVLVAAVALPFATVEGRGELVAILAVVGGSVRGRRRRRLQRVGRRPRPINGRADPDPSAASRHDALTDAVRALRAASRRHGCACSPSRWPSRSSASSRHGVSGRRSG